MKKIKPVISRTAEDLAETLGLPRSEGLEIKIRSDLNDKIVTFINKRQLTHEQVAKLAGTARTKITAIVNRNTKSISTDLLLRILSCLGVQAKIVFSKAA
jgi:predicted XRE-type DNA-binding protein